MPGKIYIEHMGCPRRALDTSKFEQYFLSNGFTISNNPKRSDYILFIPNTYAKGRYKIETINEPP